MPGWEFARDRQPAARQRPDRRADSAGGAGRACGVRGLQSPQGLLAGMARHRRVPDPQPLPRDRLRRGAGAAARHRSRRLCLWPPRRGPERRGRGDQRRADQAAQCRRAGAAQQARPGAAGNAEPVHQGKFRAAAEADRGGEQDRRAAEAAGAEAPVRRPAPLPDRGAAAVPRTEGRRRVDPRRRRVQGLRAGPGFGAGGRGLGPRRRCRRVRPAVPARPDRRRGDAERGGRPRRKHSGRASAR